MSCNTLQDALSSELILNARDFDTLKQLVYNGANINYQSEEGWCLLFELISLELSAEIRYFAYKEMDIHLKDSKGRTALFWAIHHNYPTVVKTLIEIGYNPKEYITPELPALHYAVYKNDADIVNTLLEGGVDIESKDKHQITALGYAHIYKKEEMIKLLSHKGASTANLVDIL